MLLLIDKLEMQFANLNNDPRDIWGIELPEHVPTIMIIKDNQIAARNYSKRKLMEIIGLCRRYDIKSKGIDTNKGDTRGKAR